MILRKSHLRPTQVLLDGMGVLQNIFHVQPRSVKGLGFETTAVQSS